MAAEANILGSYFFTMPHYAENFDSLYLLQRCYSIEFVSHVFLSLMG